MVSSFILTFWFFIESKTYPNLSNVLTKKNNVWTPIHTCISVEKCNKNSWTGFNAIYVKGFSKLNTSTEASTVVHRYLPVYILMLKNENKSNTKSTVILKNNCHDQPLS